MSESTPIQVGDEVRVFENLRRSGNPEGGWPGEVVKVARTLVTIRYRGSDTAFRIDTGHINSREVGSGIYFLTPGQVEARDRKTAAEAVLREAGFEVRLGKRPSGALIEALAEVARTFTTLED